MNDSLNSGVLRLLDANANRAREALRVLEDAARFICDDQALSGEIKAVRHRLTGLLQPVAGIGLLHRDTPGDVGVGIKQPGELARADVAEVVTAAAKRFGEAIRAIEEFGKIEGSGIDSRAFEALRYQGYEIERRLMQAIRPATRFDRVRLYVLITESACRGDWLAAARGALAGGADCLQLREKSLEVAELLARARVLREACQDAGALFIVNDRPDIAMLCKADGVHVGQGDLPAEDVRRLVGLDMIVGVSTHNVEQARIAQAQGADYVGIGPVFRSATKPRDFVAGLDAAREVMAAMKIPVVGIAGITLENVDQVITSGLCAVAVTSAIVGSENVERATRAFKAWLK